jgi:hypothetical protein
LKNYLHTLFFALIIFSSPLSKADTTFQLNWTSSGSASATGQITLDSTGLSYLTTPNIGPGALSSSPSSIGFTGFSITISGASSGNGTFTLQTGDTFRLFTPTALDLTRNLVGQPVAGGNWGDTAGAQGDFNYFPIGYPTACSVSNAPTGTNYFRLSTNCQASPSEYLFLSSFIAITSGPSTADTQSSMRYQASQLRSAFNTQTVAANFALNYDCNVFDVKGMCISAGGRYTTIDNPNINNSAAVVTLGYKVNPNIRIGGYLDQNINISNPTGINISNNTPLMGLYAVWNKEQSGLGYQVRLANTYQDKDVTQTRTVFDTSEAGSGKSSLQSQSYLAELSYAFQYQDKTFVRPYAGLRYTHLKQDGYTEATVTSSVDNPLTVAALRDKGTTALLGVKVNRSLTDKATLTAQLGLEQDLHHKVGSIFSD